MISKIISSLETMHKSLRRRTAVNVNDRATKDQAIDLARTYFSKARPILVEKIGETGDVTQHDELWQHLVQLAHGNSRRKYYTSTLLRLKNDLKKLNVDVLTASVIVSQGEYQVSPEQELLLDTLERFVPSAAASYRQGLTDLKETTRLSYRGTAAEFREALRETIDQMAPDDKVVKQDGFKFEKDKNKPTTKQKVRYVLSSRGRNRTQRDSAIKSVELIEELAGAVTRAVYNQASLATHVQQSKGEVEQIRRYVDTVLFDILEISIES